MKDLYHNKDIFPTYKIDHSLPIYIIDKSGITRVIYNDLKIDTEDISCSILKFKNNALGELHLDFLQRPDFRSCKIIGSSGVIYWDSNSNNVKKFDIEKKRWITKFFHEHYKRNEMYEDELEYFLKCIKTRTKTMNDISNGIKTLETSLAILKSSKNNSRIKI